MKLFYGCLIGTIFISHLFCEVLNIEKLSALIIQGNSTLSASQKNIDVQTAKLHQSRTFSNPELEIESELGEDAESTGMITQNIMLGGKRKHNIQIHELELGLSRLEYENLKTKILNESNHVFVEILHLQAQKLLQHDRITSSEELLAVVKKKVLAGKLSPAEKSRAKINLIQEESTLRKIDISLQISWKTLSAFWEDDTSPYDIAVGTFYSMNKIPSILSVENSPEILISKLSIEIQNAKIKIEKSNAFPNIQLGAGLKRSELLGNTFQVGLSIPIPIFNRNRGNINSLISEFEQIQHTSTALKFKLETDVSNHNTKLEELAYEINILNREIIPEANSAHTIINDGYLNGRFTYLDVMDAKEMWFSSKSQYLNALKEYHIHFITLNHILGNTNHNFLKEN